MKRALQPHPSPRSAPARRRVAGLLALALCSISLPLPGVAADSVGATDQRPVARADSVIKMQSAERVVRLRQARDQFLAAAAAPLPDGLSAQRRVEAKRYMVWLRVCAAHMEALAAKGDAGGGQAQVVDAASQEPQAAFNRQYLQLQDSMEHENRSYAAASNILKSTNDSVKNSISNLR